MLVLGKPALLSILGTVVFHLMLFRHSGGSIGSRDASRTVLY
jgi:hypothetical protein